MCCRLGSKDIFSPSSVLVNTNNHYDNFCKYGPAHSLKKKIVSKDETKG